MRQASTFRPTFELSAVFSRQLAVGLILAVALFAFELFNFDTTQYALSNLLGDVSFLSIRWATILAIAFCAIDFAGLVRFFSPADSRETPKEVWYLMGAWLLGATMNALMTWWAVSLTLINHQFGNEVLSRAELLRIVPVFVAALVWLTRILFIGGLTLAGGRFLHLGGGRQATATRSGEVTANKSRLQRGSRSQSLPVNRPEPVADRPERTSRPQADSPASSRRMPAQPQNPSGRSAPSGGAGRAAPPRRDRSGRPQRPPMPPVGQRLPLKADGRRES
jgi:hypothetical protein